MPTMPENVPPELTPDDPAVLTAVEIQEWIVDRLCSDLRLDRSEIELDQPIVAYGLDSMKIIGFVAELEEWLGFHFTENPLEDHSTIAALSGHLAQVNRQDEQKTSQA